VRTVRISLFHRRL